VRAGKSSGFIPASFKHQSINRHPIYQAQWQSAAPKDFVMSEKAYNSSDVPSFDTYPASPPVERVDVVPEQDHKTLEKRAAELGAAAGKVVRMVRRARSTAGNLPDHPATNRIGELAQDTRARAEQLRTAAAEFTRRLTQIANERARELAAQARERSRDLARQAKEGYARARQESGRVARKYPLHVAVGAGAVGFLLGVALRIRRSNRAI
jgi:hypothetical protein